MSVFNKKIKLLFLIIVILFYSSCKSNESKNQVIISFEIKNEEKINNCDEFSVKIRTTNQTYQLNSNNCKIVLPKIENDIKLIDIIFEYKHYYMEFNKVDINMVYVNMNINWNFQIDYPPFDEENNNSLRNEEIKKIHYLQFNPDDGQAIEIINPIR